MDFHPNLIPVHCKNQEDMELLAAEMRLVAHSDVDEIDEYLGSETEEDAKAKAIAISNKMISSGKLRFIQYFDGRVVNVCLTLKDDCFSREWHLSISHATPFGPERVKDDLAKLITDAFLKKNYDEVEPKSFWKTVRHFKSIFAASTRK